jgi:hypothetical protein
MKLAIVAIAVIYIPNPMDIISRAALLASAIALPKILFWSSGKSGVDGFAAKIRPTIVYIKRATDAIENIFLYGANGCIKSDRMNPNSATGNKYRINPTRIEPGAISTIRDN